MSDLLATVEPRECQDLPCQEIELLIETREKDLGGFSVRRVLPFRKKRQVGPWIFFDHMGPAHFGTGANIDVRPHPHINLATVTYLFDGAIMHRDSVGSVQEIQPGDLNLMVAGKGIVHSERTPDRLRNTPHVLHGLQLWLALPEEHEETDPAFYHYPSDSLPSVEVDGVPVRVMMGQAYGHTSPVLTHHPTLYVEAHLKARQTLTLPTAEERALYVAKGEVALGGTTIPEYQMAILNEHPSLEVKATKDSRIALIGGAAMSQRHLFWNFVSSRKERVEQAKDDWRAGRFPSVPGDDQEFISLP